jgi:hypothetical protein
MKAITFAILAQVFVMLINVVAGDPARGLIAGACYGCVVMAFVCLFLGV